MGDKIDERNRREEIARSIVKWQNVVFVPNDGQEGQTAKQETPDGKAPDDLQE